MARYGQDFGWGGRDRVERHEWRGGMGQHDYGSEFGQGGARGGRQGGAHMGRQGWQGSEFGGGRDMWGGYGEEQWGGGYGSDYEDWGRSRGASGMGGGMGGSMGGGYGLGGGQSDLGRGRFGGQGSNYGGYGMSSGYGAQGYAEDFGSQRFGAQGYGGQSYETGYGGYTQERGGYGSGMGGRWGGRGQEGHGGRHQMGQRGGTQVRASQIMTENPECVTPDTTLAEVAKKMRDLNVGIIPVVESQENKRLKGVVTDRDIAVRAVAEGKDVSRIKASEVMTSDVDTVNKNDTVQDVLQIMQREQVRRVPVTDREGRLVGIVAQADVAVDFLEQQEGMGRQVAHTLERISEPARPSRGGEGTMMHAGGTQQQSGARTQSGGTQATSGRSGGSTTQRQGSARTGAGVQASGSQQQQGQQNQQESQGRQQS